MLRFSRTLQLLCWRCEIQNSKRLRFEACVRLASGASSGARSQWSCPGSWQAKIGGSGAGAAGLFGSREPHHRKLEEPRASPKPVGVRTKRRLPLTEVGTGSANTSLSSQTSCDHFTLIRHLLQAPPSSEGAIASEAKPSVTSVTEESEWMRLRRWLIGVP